MAITDNEQLVIDFNMLIYVLREPFHNIQLIVTANTSEHFIGQKNRYLHYLSRIQDRLPIKCYVESKFALKEIQRKFIAHSF